MKKLKKNKLHLLFLIICFITVGIGYSYINSTLQTNIGVNLRKRRSLYFDTINIVEGSVNATIFPTADKHTTTLNFLLNLSSNTDTYSFYIDIKNDTNYKYMLNEIVKTGLTVEQESLIDYNVYYDDGLVPMTNELFQEDTNRLKVEVKVKNGANLTTSQTLNLSLDVKYVLADKNAIFSPYYFLASASSDDSSLDFSTTDGTGIYKLSETKDDQFPVYYYRGESNNKVVFNNMCWNIIRTTNTRGTKLIYAGLPKSTGACSNSSNASAYAKDSTTGEMVKFNETKTSIHDVGYMIPESSTEYGEETLNYKTNIYQEKVNSDGSKYYYDANRDNTLSYSYTTSGNQRTCRYYLKYSGTSLLNTFTNLSTSGRVNYTWYGTSCITQYVRNHVNYYVFDETTGDNGEITYYYINDSYYQSSIKIGTGYTKNDDGTYSLTGVTSIPYVNWKKTSKSTYVGRYICEYITSSTSCDTVRKISSVSNNIVSTVLYKFAKSATYQNGVYTLVNTIDDYAKNKETIESEYHYFCLNGETSCSEVAYILKYREDSVVYMLLKNGVTNLTDNVIDYSNITFNDEKDSTIKAHIDEWFSTNMTNVQDKIEDTVYCNDRSVTETYNEENDVYDNDLHFAGYNRKKILHKPTVKCALKRDSFTLNSEIGNGKLTYPVGMLTQDERLLVQGAIQGYTSFWDMTPSHFSFDFYGANVFYTVNDYGSSSTTSSNYVRPVISLKPDIKLYGGDGSESSPYKVYGDS